MDPSTLPPLDIVGPDGTHLTLRSLDPADTVGHLARRLDVDSLWTHRELRAAERLCDIDELRIGTHLHGSDPSDERGVGGDPDHDVEFDVAVVAGPATTTWHRIGVGRHLVGRSPLATVRVDDPSVELHHALLQIDAVGTAIVTQLSGPVPIRVGGAPWEGAVDPVEETRVSIGASVLVVRRSGRDLPSDVSRTGSGGSVAAHPSDPWRRVVRRAPRDIPTWRAEPLIAPTPPNEPRRPSFTGLIGTAVTACGAVVIATVMDNAMFMLFAAMGVTAAVATFLVAVVSARRASKRLRTRHLDEQAAFAGAIATWSDERREFHGRLHPTLADTIDEAMGSGERLWQRRLSPARDGHREGEPITDVRGDAHLRAVVGTGTHRWDPPIEVADRGGLDSRLLGLVDACAQLHGVAAPVSIRAGEAVGLHGPREQARSIVRSIVIQCATWVGPADWQLVVVSGEPAVWRWTDWLPHGALERGALVVLDSSIDGGRLGLGDSLDAIDATRRTVVVTDEPELYAARTGPLRRFLSASDAASLVVVGTDATVPATCRRVLTVGATGSGSWSGEIVDSDDTVAIAYAGVSVGTADRVARRLACLVDPEDDGGASGGVPPALSFADLRPDTSAAAIVHGWQQGGVDPAPIAPLGMSLDGRVDIDLVRDGPHGLIAGTTGAGKSELLRTLVLSLAASVAPQHLNFVLVDYKGGSTFDACVELPHTVGLVTDLDDGLAERALVSLDAELHRRERILRSVGASDLTAYRACRSERTGSAEAIARLVVVIDEFAALAKDLPDFLSALVGIAQRGRSLGLHLLLATQRPAGVVNDDIRANTNLRLALRLHDTPDAVDVVGDALPATFPRGLPGRAALRLGPDELMVFQTARCTGPVTTGGVGGMVVDRPHHDKCRRPTRDEGAGDEPGGEIVVTELDSVVGAIKKAASALDLGAPHRPWVDPLPFPLVAEELGADADERAVAAIGWVDDPAHQRREPLTWHPDDGSLALIGSLGSGTTSTMIALAAATCGAFAPDGLHLYVVDGRGDEGLGALASLAHCGGVVRLTEDERVHRLLARVVEAIDRRMDEGSVAGSTAPQVVVMIDGYGSLRTSLGGIERQATFELFQRAVNDGPAVGIAMVIADDAGTAISTVPVAHRWLFHLDDPGAARGLGLTSAPVGPGRPGRLRILGSGLEAQVARGAPGLAALPSRSDSTGLGPPAVRTLAERIHLDDLSQQPVGRSSGTMRLPIGVAAADLELAHIELVDGDHLLVVGGPRSGVTTALTRVATAWELLAETRDRPFRVIRLDRRARIEPDVVANAVADTTTRCAIVVDDAHRVDDPGLLAEIAAGDHPHVTVLAGGRADAVRTTYGHWTREIAKSRCGIVMASRDDPDGDVLSVQLPRRPLIPARPGLAWVVDGGALRQVQIAIDRDP